MSVSDRLYVSKNVLSQHCAVDAWWASGKIP